MALFQNDWRNQPTNQSWATKSVTGMQSAVLIWSDGFSPGTTVRFWPCIYTCVCFFLERSFHGWKVAFLCWYGDWFEYRRVCQAQIGVPLFGLTPRLPLSLAQQKSTIQRFIHSCVSSDHFYFWMIGGGHFIVFATPSPQWMRPLIVFL